MFVLIAVLHFLFSLTIILLVLLQQGTGANIGTLFNTKAQKNIFGNLRGTPTIFKATLIFAFMFFITSISLSYINKNYKDDKINTNFSQVSYQSKKISKS